MGKRKTAEQKADEARRYALAAEATTDAEFEPFFADSNQAIRNEAAANRRASSAVLDRFAADPFWSVRLTVVDHPNTSRRTLLSLLSSDPKSRGVVHHAAMKRLESEGVRLVPEADPS